MPGIGWTELVIILVAVIVFVKPEDLPRFCRAVGRVYGDLQRQFTRFRHYTRDTLGELQSLDRTAIEEWRRPLSETIPQGQSGPPPAPAEAPAADPETPDSGPPPAG